MKTYQKKAQNVTKKTNILLSLKEKRFVAFVSNLCRLVDLGLLRMLICKKKRLNASLNICMGSIKCSVNL